jgi:hypothetical protein
MAQDAIRARDLRADKRLDFPGRRGAVSPGTDEDRRPVARHAGLGEKGQDLLEDQGVRNGARYVTYDDYGRFPPAGKIEKRRGGERIGERFPERFPRVFETAAYFALQAVNSDATWRVKYKLSLRVWNGYLLTHAISPYS